MALKPYQERVVQEKKELDEKRGKLANFLGTEAFSKLDVAEQSRMSHQAKVMDDYSAVLGERIANFTTG